MSRVGRKTDPGAEGRDRHRRQGRSWRSRARRASSSARLPRASVKVETAHELHVARADDSHENRAKHGLMRALLANMVKGVTDGFERKLEINGVGYRAEVDGQKLNLALGFSHPVVFALPKGIAAKVDKNTRHPRRASTRRCSARRPRRSARFRPPEPYKGKGIKYVEEVIKRKVGKTGAA